MSSLIIQSKANPVANFLAEEAQDTGTIGSLCKISRGGVKLAAQCEAITSEAAGTAIIGLSIVTDTFKTLGIFKNIKDIDETCKSEIPQSQKDLKIAKASFGIIGNLMGGAKLLENFNLYKLGTISKEFGFTASAMGEAGAAALSFSSIMSYFELIEGILAITISSINLKNLNPKLQKGTEKINKWTFQHLHEIADKKIKDLKPGKKKTRWELISNKINNNTLTQSDIKKLNKLVLKKKAKWEIKVKNISLDKIKEGISLGIAIFITLASIALIALNILMPGGSLAFAILGLLVAIASLVRHYVPKIIKFFQIEHPSVKVPKLE